MKKVVSLIAAAGLTAAAILGAVLSGGSGFWFASAAASVLCCIPLFLSFEKRAPSAGELVLIAVMTAFSAAGRFIFAPVPFFKPVSAFGYCYFNFGDIPVQPVSRHKTAYAAADYYDIIFF